MQRRLGTAVNGRIPSLTRPSRLLAHLGRSAAHPCLVGLDSYHSTARPAHRPRTEPSSALSRAMTVSTVKAQPTLPVSATSLHTLSLPNELRIQNDDIRSEVFRHSATADELVANKDTRFNKNNQNLAVCLPSFPREQAALLG